MQSLLDSVMQATVQRTRETPFMDPQELHTDSAGPARGFMPDQKGSSDQSAAGTIVGSTGQRVLLSKHAVRRLSTLSPAAAVAAQPACEELDESDAHIEDLASISLALDSAVVEHLQVDPSSSNQHIGRGNHCSCVWSSFLPCLLPS